MPSLDARTAIDQQMQRAVEALEEATRTQTVNLLLARMAGGVAGLVGRPDLVDRIKKLLSGFTYGDLLSGAITNLGLPTERAERTVEIPSTEEAERDHPKVGDAFILVHARFHGGEGTRSSLAGDLDSATRLAKSPQDLEEVACSLAVMGELDLATKWALAQPVPLTTLSHVKFIILLERCRR